jgi:hypothetical protein
MKISHRLLLSAASFTALLACASPLVSQETIRVPFLGDRGHHKPSERSRQLNPYLLHRDIKLHYTESLADLTTRNLRLRILP